MIHFELVSTTGTKFEDDVYEVLVPAQGGAVAIFQDHMPLISAAQPGVLSVRKKSSDKDDDMESFAVSGGILEVDGKNLRFIADEISAPEDISEKEAEAALARAEELIAKAGSQVELAAAHRMLSHSSAQLNVARMRRHRYN
jgi:F-type H+-transporting ATPase subunit epsilon